MTSDFIKIELDQESRLARVVFLRDFSAWSALAAQCNIY